MTSESNAFGEFTTDDLYLAALCCYGAGESVISRVEITTGGIPKLFVKMKALDFQIYAEEYAAVDGHLIGIHQFCTALRVVQSLVTEAKRKGGTYVRPYVRPVVRP